MFDAVLNSGARAVSSMTFLLPYIEQDNLYRSARSYAGSDRTGRDVFEMLRGSDGRVSVASISSIVDGTSNTIMIADSSLRAILQRFWAETTVHMRLGALHEDIRRIPGVGYFSPTLAGVYTFSDLSNLTRQYVSDATLQLSLTGLVSAAEAAELKGDLMGKEKALAQYGASLQRSATIPMAEALIQIAKSM